MIEPIRIDPQKDTPLVDFNPEIGVLKIKGRSHPEDPIRFWLPLLEWTENYLSRTRKEITVEIDLSYFNTSSCKCLLDFMSILEDYHNKEHQVLIKWIYKEDDEETREAGEDLADDVEVAFEFVVR